MCDGFVCISIWGWRSMACPDPGTAGTGAPPAEGALSAYPGIMSS